MAVQHGTEQISYFGQVSAVQLNQTVRRVVRGKWVRQRRPQRHFEIRLWRVFALAGNGGGTALLGLLHHFFGWTNERPKYFSQTFKHGLRPREALH